MALGSAANFKPRLLGDRLFMRDNWLSNRVFASHEDILDHCCDAWNKLVDQPWKIMSIGLRDWANEF